MKVVAHIKSVASRRFVGRNESETREGRAPRVKILEVFWGSKLPKMQERMAANKIPFEQFIFQIFV